MDFVFDDRPFPAVECDAALLGVTVSDNMPDSIRSLGDRTAAAVERAWKKKIFAGAAEQSFTVPAPDGMKADFLVLVGLGGEDELSPETIRRSFAAAAKASPVSRSAVLAVSASGLPDCDSLRAALEGVALASYRFDAYLSEDPDKPRVALEKVLICGRSCSSAPRKVEESVRWVSWARDVVNEPANVINPQTFAERGRALASALGVEFGVLEEDELRKKGMNAILAVGKGSAVPPRLFWLRYTGDPSSPDRIALVGKGLTFDSGGLCIKGAQGMDQMKSDMAGAATMLAAFGMIVSFGLPVNVDCVVGAAENMPSGGAYRPGDILHTYSGKTVEVLNTDAEGRLVLADAISYAVKDLGASRVVDAATLTGAAVVALGQVCTAVFSDDDSMYEALEKAADETGEKIWRMPVFPEYKKMLKSKIADLKNIGGRWGGAITAAVFLQAFADGKPWMHLDIAPTASVGSPESTPPYAGSSPCGTGAMVRTVAAFVEKLASKRQDA